MRRDWLRRLMEIEGVGLISASAMVAAVGDARQFKSGRDLAAWLGLVPNQHSSGGKERLGSISKRGDAYLRTLLIHGAQSAVNVCREKTDRKSQWIKGLVMRRNKNIATVALANKNARTIWALLRPRRGLPDSLSRSDARHGIMASERQKRKDERAVIQGLYKRSVPPRLQSELS